MIIINFINNYPVLESYGLKHQKKKKKKKNETIKIMLL